MGVDPDPDPKEIERRIALVKAAKDARGGTISLRELDKVLQSVECRRTRDRNAKIPKGGRHADPR